MTKGRKLWRWLPLLPILALAEVFLILQILYPNEPPEVVGGFVLPARGSGRPVQALYRVQALALQEGWTPDLLRLAGDLWREAGDLTNALPYWEAAAQDGNDVILLRDIAEAALSIQGWASASDALQQLAALLPEDTWANLQLGLIQAAVNPREALDHLNIALREPAYAPIAGQLIDTLWTASASPAIGLSVGSIMADHDLWAYAELAFTQTAGAQPLPETLAYIGFARDMQGKDGGSWIDDAVAISPNNPTVRLLQGLHLRQIGDYTGSLDILISAVALDPQNPVMYAELSTAYRLSGDLSSARYWMEQAVTISNNDPRFQQMLDSLVSEEAGLLEALSVSTEAANAATAEPLP